jgi:type IV pilus assembly protein PilE
MNSYSESAPGLVPRRQTLRGFTLIELMITVFIIGIIAAVAYPSYTQYVVRASRQAAQTELVQLSNLQEKIYLNSSAYAASVTVAYDGTSTGGLGHTSTKCASSDKTTDCKYTITISPTTSGQSYTLTATPVSTSPQANDGLISISSTGAKIWGSTTW